MTTHTHSVWLGSDASIWAHRGYVVRGERVLCESRKDAKAVVARTCGEDLVVWGGSHFYASREECDADEDGTGACAVIDEIDDDDEMSPANE
ncbi:MAG: hypothetical protein IPK64_19780 [bacterium]|nr:hypothetical protein [bacterium]